METIPEFIDNSIDGAERLRGEGALDGLRVELNIDEDRVIIADNCGGIPRELAENYAFRFGRPDEISQEFESTIGKFGVGMKRSIFKLGRKFLVESNPVDEDRYVIEEDIDEWEQQEEDEDQIWTFRAEYAPSDDPRCELSENGTRIVVEELNDEARNKFSDELFISRLRERLVSEFSQFLERRFEIVINGQSLDYVQTNIIDTSEIGTALKHLSLEEFGTDVDVEIIAGLGESDPDEAGWYVFCNGRQVLEADQTEKTGWNGDEIPKFHNQFSRFRGYVNFQSDDPGALPWNTSKTDINTDASVYRTAKQEMVNAMRPIIDFLNDVRQEQRQMEDDEDSPLEQLIANSDSITLNEVDTENDRDFDPPDSENVEDDGPEMGTIRYKREVEKIRELAEELGVENNSDVGRQTFDYYYRTRVQE